MISAPRLALAVPLLAVAGALLWHPASPAHLASSVEIRAQPGVSPSLEGTVTTDLRAQQPVIDADFGIRRAPRLVARLYATHRAFAAVLHRSQGVWPQGRQDDLGNVAGNTLPIGPHPPYLTHNLSHVYTEWLLDRLTHNRSDRQPSPAWLYDGIAEYEADRRGGALPCRIPGTFPLPLSSLASPQQWWRIRATAFGDLAYCEARIAAERLITRVGWDRVARLLRRDVSWPAFAARLQSAPAHTRR